MATTRGTEPEPESPHYLGHRDRLRAKLLGPGPEALADYELLEFLLFSARPRGDMKPLAKALLTRFGSLAGVLGADKEALLTVRGMGDASVAALLATRAAAVQFLRGQLTQRPVLSSWQALIDYCNAAQGFAEVEELRLLFLDRKNALIADERQQRGTVDHTPAYPREVVKRALDLGASALILLHNYPSRDPSSPTVTFDHHASVIKRDVRRAAVIPACSTQLYSLLRGLGAGKMVKVGAARLVAIG